MEEQSRATEAAAEMQDSFESPVSNPVVSPCTQQSAVLCAPVSSHQSVCDTLFWQKE